jgi:hypothetical protein
MLEPAMFVGLGGVAVWTYFRYPRLGPSSLLWAALHVAASFFAFALVPAASSVLLPLVPSHLVRLCLLFALLILTLTYVLLSWVWLIGLILRTFGGKPRGGHPVATD